MAFNTRKFLFLIHVCVLFAIGRLTAQQELPYSKWGVVTPEDQALVACPFDPEAHVMVLHDVGTTRMDNSGRSFEVKHSRFRRVKVFNMEGFKQEMLNIAWRAGKSGEVVSDLDVQHILPGGNIEKISSDHIFSEKINEYWKVKKIFVPNLQPGSIVEYRYEINSDYVFSLYDWYFHDDLPVRWSEITTTILPYFEYQFLSRFHKPLDLHESKPLSDGSYMVRMGFRDLPAMKEEPFMTSLDRYRSHVRFQLSATQFPNRGKEKVMTTWEKSARELEDYQSFGRQYEKGAKFNDAWAGFSPQLAAGDTPETIAEKALRFVTENIGWTGYYRLTTEKDLDDAFRRKKGSSAELNLMLVALLRKADLNAVPVLISTREHGATYETYPFMEQFNSVAAMLRAGDKKIFLDATNPYLAVNQLSEQHANMRGWVVDHAAPEWVDLPTPEVSAAWLGDAILKADGSVTGHFSMSAGGLIAADWRSQLESVKVENFIKKRFSGRYAEIQCDSVKTDKEVSSKKNFALSFQYALPGGLKGDEEIIYFSPIFDFFVTENPFKSVRRDFPVNFSGPVRANYIMHLTLPEGYALEEEPANSRISLPNQTGNISFRFQKDDETHVQLLLRMTLSKVEYESEYYDLLRQYFDLVAEKVNTKLVIKKK